MDKLHRGYVRLDSGKFAVQIPSEDSRWGFFLATASGAESQSWDGGIGIAGEWEVVSETEVPADVREEMGWLLDA